MSSTDSWNLLCAVLALISLGVAGFIIRAFAGLSVRRLSIGGLFWYFYAVMVVVPSIVVFYDHPDAPVRFLFLASAAVALRFGPRDIAGFFTKPVARSSPGFGGATFAALCFCIIVTVMYFIESPSVPLVYAVRHPGEAAAFTVMRQESFRLLDSPFLYLYFIVRQTGWPMVVSLLFVRHLQRRSLSTLLLFLGAVALAVFYAAASLIRGPAAVIFIVLAMTWLVWRGGRFNVYTAILAFVAILGIPVAILLLFSPDRSVVSVLEGIGRRLYYVPAENGFYYVDAFSRYHPLLYGRSIEKVALFVRIILPDFASFDSGNYIFRFAFPESAVTSGSANAPFYGDAFANFGFVGVIVFGFLAGVTMQATQVWICRRPKDALTVVCYGTLLYSFWELNRTAFTSVLLSYGGLIVVGAYVVFRLVERAVAGLGGRNDPIWSRDCQINPAHHI